MAEAVEFLTAPAIGPNTFPTLSPAPDSVPFVYAEVSASMSETFDPSPGPASLPADFASLLADFASLPDDFASLPEDFASLPEDFESLPEVFELEADEDPKKDPYEDLLAEVSVLCHQH